mmetsp:Transcript_34957/g.77735  ORF Transcript_34957/g.77735 Transcript_34957/m.77735 type:complete len:308 (+) Transcript_34957:1452-2375(+)
MSHTSHTPHLHSGFSASLATDAATAAGTATCTAFACPCASIAGACYRRCCCHLQRLHISVQVCVLALRLRAVLHLLQLHQQGPHELVRAKRDARHGYQPQRGSAHTPVQSRQAALCDDAGHDSWQGLPRNLQPPADGLQGEGHQLAGEGRQYAGCQAGQHTGLHAVHVLVSPFEQVVQPIANCSFWHDGRHAPAQPPVQGPGALRGDDLLCGRQYIAGGRQCATCDAAAHHLQGVQHGPAGSTCHACRCKGLDVAALITQQLLEGIKCEKVKSLLGGTPHDIQGIPPEQRPPASPPLHQRLGRLHQV